MRAAQTNAKCARSTSPPQKFCIHNSSFIVYRVLRREREQEKDNEKKKGYIKNYLEVSKVLYVVLPSCCRERKRESKAYSSGFPEPSLLPRGHGAEPTPLATPAKAV